MGFKNAFRISKESDWETLQNKLDELDIFSPEFHKRNDTETSVIRITNIIIYAYITDYISFRGKGDSGRIACLNDNLCLFRAYARHQNQKIIPSKETVVALYQRYQQEYSMLPNAPSYFSGFKLKHFNKFSDFFKVKIRIYSNDSNRGELFFESLRKYKDVMVLESKYDHLSLITDLSKVFDTFQCKTCTRCFKKKTLLNRHQKICTGNKCVKILYTGGCFSKHTCIFDEFHKFGISTLGAPSFLTKFIVFDLEALLIPTDIRVGEKTCYYQEHRLLSFALCHNVGEGETLFRRLKVNSEIGVQNLVTEFVLICNEISDLNYELMKEQYNVQLLELNKKIKDLKKSGEKFGKGHPLFTFKKRFHNFLRKIPVISFNGGKYDIFLMKRHLFSFLLLSESKPPQVLMRGNKYLCIETERLKFLDAINYFQGNLESFIETYSQTGEKKYSFPYNYIKSLDTLSEEKIPPIEAFHDDLKDTPLSIEKYNFVCQLWSKHGWTNIGQYLEAYNKNDVKPFHTSMTNY